MASLLGHSHTDKKKQSALCSCAKTHVDHMGRSPCLTKGADYTYSNTPEPGKVARDKHQKGILPCEV